MASIPTFLKASAVSGSGINGKPEIGELPDNVNDLRLVAIPDGDENAASFAQLVARGLQPLVQGLLAGCGDAQDLARRFHLRPQLRVDVQQLFKREHGYLDGDVGRLFVQPRPVAHIGEPFADHAARGQLHHRNACDLADIRNCPARSGD